MSDSLRDQLLKAGLVNKKQAAQAERQQNQRQYQQTKGPRKPAPGAGQTPPTAQAQAAKAARDQALNREQQARAEAKARHAQVKQLIEQNRLPRVESDEYFNFVVGNKVRRIPVNADLRDRLTRGALAIVRCEGRYDLVPLEAAARIRERDERAVVPLDSGKSTSAPGDDDPYKDYVVPDDLMW